MGTRVKKTDKRPRGRPVSTGTGKGISLYLPVKLIQALKAKAPKGHTLEAFIREILEFYLL